MPGTTTLKRESPTLFRTLRHVFFVQQNVLTSNLFPECEDTNGLIILLSLLHSLLKNNYSPRHVSRLGPRFPFFFPPFNDLSTFRKLFVFTFILEGFPRNGFFLFPRVHPPPPPRFISPLSGPDFPLSLLTNAARTFLSSRNAAFQWIAPSPPPFPNFPCLP